MQKPTCEIVIRPGAQLTGLAGVLIKHKLIFFAGSARPAAAHLSFTDHLKEREREEKKLFVYALSEGY